ncbi:MULTISPECIES: Atxe2 family lasso peptide isopeptidase [unclassified Novosphingobium]|uniref:Atxe2 family lasso peptide isopeptidase n=1 Tax=unclassified Novosphingobium TaxID=2644732 RepID=UPI00146A9712|nr:MULTISPECIES: Atxe2 family lasso peptide isopeptidase [unclassified Novosphingobium]NMN04816.1 dipeptidyl aminopeptidase/acylaminoacyl peptidase [Novosphingobium sp. SG919]NMN85190.1 dipeptidyl aminopeptidase/acylaminoacyl peptidase [Novosphingobium sp. SG916]
MALALSLLLAEATVAWPVVPPSVADRCDPPAITTSAAPASRLVTAQDLARLVDIGRSDPYDTPPPFGLSPDGKTIAVLLRQADPAHNAYCQRLVLIPAVPPEGQTAAPREIDRGGAFIPATYPLRTFPALRAGYGQVITPHWSPDGRTIAYIKQTAGPPQVWLVPRDGGAARALTALPDAVENLAWNAEGTALIIATRPALRAQSEAITATAHEGYLYDDRFAPELADHPIPSAPMPLVYSHVDIASGIVQPATSAEQAILAPPGAPGQPPQASSATRSADGRWAWIEPIHPAWVVSARQVVIEAPARRGQPRRWLCPEALCDGTMHLWWSRSGTTLYLLQRTGWGRSQTRLLRWRSGTPRPEPVLTTDDVLVGCVPAPDALYCARESSAHPRVLVRIDWRSGASRTVFDPNPQWAQFRLGPIQRLKVRNAYGVENHADLVLPPGHRRGQRHPLVVVQYVSEGFLRGGTGDENPIQPLAARGFAVLSFARPTSVPSVRDAPNETELMRREHVDWLDRRSVQSALEEALRQAVATRTVDPARMGITGMSEGTSMTQWALLNSKLFKAAELGVCCEGPTIYPLVAGPVFERLGRQLGTAWFEPNSEQVWKPMDLAANAERITAPILIQSDDSEYTNALDVVARFRLLGKPIEMWVMPGEPHFKWQPAHRLAMYERTMDWFSFWLQHQRDCDPNKATQYQRWLAMPGAPSKDEVTCLPSRP